jgi:hypothetical protein
MISKNNMERGFSVHSTCFYSIKVFVFRIGKMALLWWGFISLEICHIGYQKKLRISC